VVSAACVKEVEGEVFARPANSGRRWSPMLRAHPSHLTALATLPRQRDAGAVSQARGHRTDPNILGTRVADRRRGAASPAATDNHMTARHGPGGSTFLADPTPLPRHASRCTVCGWKAGRHTAM
jgi:hypothetical protein